MLHAYVSDMLKASSELLDGKAQDALQHLNRIFCINLKA